MRLRPTGAFRVPSTCPPARPRRAGRARCGRHAARSRPRGRGCRPPSGCRRSPPRTPGRRAAAAPSRGRGPGDVISCPGCVVWIITNAIANIQWVPVAEWRMKMASARLRLAAPARRRSVRSARRRRRGRARTAARGSRGPRGSCAAQAPS